MHRTCLLSSLLTQPERSNPSAVIWFYHECYHLLETKGDEIATIIFFIVVFLLLPGIY